MLDEVLLKIQNNTWDILDASLNLLDWYLVRMAASFCWLCNYRSLDDIKNSDDVLTMTLMMAPAHRNSASLASAWNTSCSSAPSKAVLSSMNSPHST